MTRVVPALHDRHAPTTLQEAFYAALEAYDEWRLDEDEPSVRFEDRDVPISSIFGRMRASDDLVPEKVRLAYRDAAAPLADEADDSDLTYAQVAVRMRELSLERLRDTPQETAKMP